MKNLSILSILLSILLHSCSSTKTTVANNNECEEYFTYLQNTIKREKETITEGGFKKFYINEKIEFVDDKPKFSKFLEEFIQHRNCLIDKDVNFVKSLFLPGEIPEKLKHHVHELYANVETLEHGHAEDISSIYPIKTIAIFFRTGGAIKKIELTYNLKNSDTMFIHFF